MSEKLESETPVAAATHCSACGGSGMGKPMYRPEIDKVQRDRCYYCQGTGKAKPESMDMFPHEMIKRAIAPPWKDCPTGTVAYSHTGTNWTKEPDGRWRANGGDAFPTPGADACLVRLPNTLLDRP